MIRWTFVLGVAGLVLWSAFSIAGPPAAADGEATYKAKCAMCHGPDGAGDTTMGKKLKVRDLRSADVQKQTDAQLADIISKGKSPMQGYEKSLDKAKIDDLVAYLREQGKKK
jgi:mono/diheme cytochrome c family protein